MIWTEKSQVAVCDTYNIILNINRRIQKNKLNLITMTIGLMMIFLFGISFFNFPTFPFIYTANVLSADESTPTLLPLNIQAMYNLHCHIYHRIKNDLSIKARFPLPMIVLYDWLGLTMLHYVSLCRRRRCHRYFLCLCRYLVLLNGF